MNKITLTALCAMALAGCATKPLPTVEKVDEMPADKYVVARSLEEALNRSEKRINQNNALLLDVEGRKTMSPQVLEHNNLLDARSPADKRKIIGPQFPQMDVARDVANNIANNSVNDSNSTTNSLVDDYKGSDAAKVAKFENNVQRLEWKNGSLNDFVRKIASEVGYDTEITPGRDTTFSMTSSNITVMSVLAQAAQINSNTASITVSHVRQKILVKYK